VSDLPPSTERIQDLSKKIAIVVAANLEPWQTLNTVAHIAAYLGNKMTEPFDTGSSFVTKDNNTHPRNSQFPIVVLSAKPGQLKNLIKTVRDSGLSYLGFIREMIETSDDEEIARVLSAKSDDEIEYLGIGVFGGKAGVDLLTKKFSLWK
jgi:hypothetical protein